MSPWEKRGLTGAWRSSRSQNTWLARPRSPRSLDFEIPRPQPVDLGNIIPSVRNSEAHRWSSRRLKELPALKLKIDFANLHPVVAASGRGYLGARAGPDGTYGEQSHAGLKLRVSPSNLERALQLADKLFKAAEARGYKIGSGDSESKAADIVIEGEAVRVDVKEKLESRINKGEDSRWRKRIFVPTGHLLFVIGGGYGSKPECGDSSRWKAEDRIEKVLEKVEETARGQRESRIRAEKQRKEWEEEWKREQEAEARRVEEKRKGEEFLGLIEKWRKAEEIRSFVGRIRQIAADSGYSIEASSDLGKQMAWAENYADQLDPLANYRKRFLK